MSPPERRILMTTDAVGGVWTFATALSRALCQSGHKVTLVTMGPRPGPHQLEALTDTRGLTVEVTDLALEWMDPEGEDIPRACYTLLRVADRVRPDLVHLNSFREAIFAFGVPTLVAAHSCVGSWWVACRDEVPLEARWHTYLHYVAGGLNAATCWTAPTRAYRDWVEAAYRPRSTGHAIWNGLSLSRASGRKEPFVLAAGRLWDEAKNLTALAVAAADIPWEVRVAGPMQLADAAPCIKGASPLVHLGQLSHERLLATMRHASIFVAPAVYEPFGLTVLEAAHCGCALVLSDIPTFRELWDDAAVFVDPHDTAALQQILQRLTIETNERARLQAAARKRAARYSLKGMVGDYQRLYDAMLEEPAAPCASPEMELCA